MFSILALYTTFRSFDLFRGKSYFGVHILFKNCPMFQKMVNQNEITYVATSRN